MGLLDNPMILRALRAAQFIFAVIVLGTAAHVANWWTSPKGWPGSRMAPSSISFLIFCAVWTILAVLYLVLVPWRFSHTAAASLIAVTVVEGLTMIFWFAGFIATAVWLSDRDCFGGVCSSARAATVFGAFDWLLFAGTMALATMALLHNRGKSHATTNDAPAMSVHQGV